MTPSLMLSRIDCRILVCFCSASCERASSFERCSAAALRSATRCSSVALSVFSSSCARSRSLISCSSSCVRVCQVLVGALQGRVALLDLGEHELKPSMSAPISSFCDFIARSEKFF